ncbi:MAG TPA: hypothetical protein VLA19_25935 [Herpetosiphonaceae bacterium]|nr:hypothetical protein [Herpetosiphonaceae bacterium]
MDLFESHTHSFIVKIWREQLSPTGDMATWRGHITHVPGGEQRYVHDLDDIVVFITGYIEKMGVKLTVRRQVRQRLKRWTQRLQHRK